MHARNATSGKSARSAHIPASSEQIASFCRRHHIRRLSLFGSVLRDDFGPESDVDVLVEFDPDHVPGWEVYDIEQEFSRLCGGRKVDFVNPRYLHPRMRESVLRTAELQYGEE